MTTITGTAILIELLQYTITNTSNENSNNTEIIMDSDICLSSTNDHLLISGLVNTGNSCFLNSVLQSLSSLPKLHSYLYQINQKTASLFISKPLLKTLRLLSRPSNATFKPSELVSILSNCLINKEQQDAQELFQIISTTLDNENQFARRQQGLSSLLSNASTSKLPESPFTGLLANRLSCMQCGYTEAIRHFSFNNVQLTLPNHDKTTLEDCLHQLTAMEFLNDVICRKCTLIETIRHTNAKLEQNPSDQILLNTKQELEKRLSMGLIEQEKEAACTTKGLSSKQAMFAKSPKILCLHTARSSLDLSTGEIYKNTCQVEFPEILDLSPYCTNGVLNTTDPHLPISSPLHTAVPIKYRLMSIVVHYGSHDYGHFIAYKRRLIAEKCHCTSCSDDQTVLKHHESNWFKISDEHVEACTVDDVLSANPYMLLYEMVEEEQVSDIETEEEEEEEHWIQQPIAPPSSPLLAPLQKASCSFYKPLSNPQRRSSKSLWTEAPTAVC
ncbi:hypothetical protein G6F46_005411 [Rhizopus delemar]|uniref:Ubiquitin carboxyl-terminal hydrolase n=2 Tax=Rhizopus TaxID=4842 RepID=A0A9P6ZAL5_9FUNG|nr:hypothetical protein G6F55_001075 [Rhizopus delemar]KAG1546905.1 hypothetical protein G6F51_004593 [Rhizopus arrhizus]KAG1498884.1 hypothetical protein G6F54_004769 [Rhizopus delemar]KAG1516829.1 hypothetical protein G6F53_001857 [Rhizopus delemar]KAG1526234.1 hypothetical protein G6F52_002616 [Rhizopus delemar]